jgi:hypothetical protein
MRMASPKLRPSRAAARSASLKRSIMRLSCSRSTSTQRPRTSASPSVSGQQLANLGRGQRFAVERNFHPEIEQRILPQQRRRRAAHLAVTRGRGGR